MYRRPTPAHKLAHPSHPVSTVDGTDWRTVLPPSPPSTIRGSIDSDASDTSTKAESLDQQWEVVRLPYTPPRVHWAVPTSPPAVKDVNRFVLEGLSPKSQRIVELPEVEEKAPVKAAPVAERPSPPILHRTDGMPQEARKPSLTIDTTFSDTLSTPKKPSTEERKTSSDATALPDGPALDTAMSCLLIDEHGLQTTFGDVIDRHHRTVVLFIRHFWCGFCQAYIEHLVSAVRDEDVQRRIEAAKVKVVIIGHGHRSMLSKYKGAFLSSITPPFRL